MATANPYAASASALGYAYQFRYALYQGLTALRTSYDWSIAIEAADDLEYVGTDARELKQLKHRKLGETLSDSSVDLWKTLRIWSDGVKSGEIDPVRDRLILVTTASANADTISSLLSADDAKRDVVKSKETLDEISRASKNKENEKCYKSWSSLTDDQKVALLRAVTIACNTPDITSIDVKIKELVRLGNRAEHILAFIERLEGWWFRRCLELLTNSRGPISAEELDNFYNDLREQFSPNNLPVDEDIRTTIVSPDVEEHADRVFVKQVQMVGVSNPRLQAAVRDYLRAFTQRSRWSRQNLVSVGELALYEQRLHEEWQLIFERWRDDMSDADADAEKTRVAKKIYAWVEDATATPIRPGCTETFVTRGSLHMLADTSQVGWHPDFMTRLSSILEPAASSA